MDSFYHGIAYWHVLWPLCVVGCLIWFPPMFFHRWAVQKWPQKREALIQARILATILLAAVLVDEGIIRVIPIPHSFRMLYTITYAIKWEIAALAATFFISLEYWRAQKNNIGKIDPNHHFNAMTFIGVGIFFFAGACACICTILLTTSEPVLHVVSYLHFLFLAALSWCFWRVDDHIYNGVKVRPQTTPDLRRMHDLKRMSHNLVYLVDIPTFVSLSLLGAFCLVHWLEHHFGASVRPFLQRPPRSLEPVNIWTSEEYFVSGMVAFQYLAMTVVAVVIAFNPKPNLARARRQRAVVPAADAETVVVASGDRGLTISNQLRGN